MSADLPPASSATLCFALPTVARGRPRRLEVERIRVALAERGGVEGDIAVALGRLVPSLLCGEESSVLVFHRERERLGPDAWRESRDLLGRVMDEEEEHARLLGSLRDQLQDPDDLRAIERRSRRFLMRLAAAGTVADHFSRIAELDACVCLLVSALLEGDVGRDPVLGALFSFIRTDERQHVRIARDHVQTLTARPVDDLAARGWIRDEIVGLLTPVADAFDRIAVDPDRLFRRIRMAG